MSNEDGAAGIEASLDPVEADGMVELIEEDDVQETVVESSSRADEEARRHTLQPLALKKDNSGTLEGTCGEPASKRAEEELRVKLAAEELKLMKSEDTIKYLKELLMVKDKKMEVLQEEVAARRTEPAAYQAHHKQVYSLVDKLQKTEEEVQARMAELAKMKVEMQSNEEKAVLFDTLAMQNSKKDAKIEQLTRFLKASRTQMRQMAPQMARLQQQEQSLQQELRETQAKYGLLPESEIAQVIARQREFSQENEELKERMVMKDMTVNELKLMKDTLEQELERSTLALKAVEEDKAKMEELMRRRVRQHEEKQEELSKELADSRKQIIDLTAEVTKLQEDKKAAEGHASDLMTQLGVAREMSATVEREMELYRTKMADLEEEDKELKEEMELVKRKLVVSTELSQAVRKEMAFKDACIQSLQQKLRETKSDPPTEVEERSQAPVSPRRQQAGHMRSSSRGAPAQHRRTGSRPEDPAVEKARQELAEAREACQAHQAHSSFMESEINRVQREKKMEIQIKNETIHRLRRELECTQRLYNDLRVQQPGSNELASRTYSPPPQRFTRNKDASTDGVSESAQDEIDDLKSQVHLLKQQYFRSVALGIKLQLTKFFVAPNINVDELFEKLPSDLPVQDWPKYIETSIQAIIDKQKADGNLVSLRSN